MSKKISMICPHCKQSFDRKPTKLEEIFAQGPNISVKLLLFLYNNRCKGCDVRFKSIDDATIDHIQPKSKGGKNGLHNYQLLCQPCNRKKGNKWYPNGYVHTVRLKDYLTTPHPINNKKRNNMNDNNMTTYKPSTELFYVIESDGDSWFAHYNTFTNVQEDDEVAFGETPQQALQKFIDSRVKAAAGGQ